MINTVAVHLILAFTVEHRIHDHTGVASLGWRYIRSFFTSESDIVRSSCQAMARDSRETANFLESGTDVQCEDRIYYPPKIMVSLR
jgi:hypothetical protein